MILALVWLTVSLRNPQSPRVMGRLPEEFTRFQTSSPQRAMDLGQPRPVGDGTRRDHVGEGPDHPIYHTSHAEAEEFCRRLTEIERVAGWLETG